MGVFAADLAFRTNKLPGWGETFTATRFIWPGRQGFEPGCGGGACGREGELHQQAGHDPFGDLARATYLEAESIPAFTHVKNADRRGCHPHRCVHGGENSIIVVLGASSEMLTPEEIEPHGGPDRQLGNLCHGSWSFPCRPWSTWIEAGAISQRADHSESGARLISYRNRFFNTATT